MSAHMQMAVPAGAAACTFSAQYAHGAPGVQYASSYGSGAQQAGFSEKVHDVFTGHHQGVSHSHVQHGSVAPTAPMACGLAAPQLVYIQGAEAAPMTYSATPQSSMTYAAAAPQVMYMQGAGAAPMTHSTMYMQSAEAGPMTYSAAPANTMTYSPAPPQVMYTGSAEAPPMTTHSSAPARFGSAMPTAAMYGATAPGTSAPYMTAGLAPAVAVPNGLPSLPSMIVMPGYQMVPQSAPTTNTLEMTPSTAATSVMAPTAYTATGKKSKKMKSTKKSKECC